MAWTSVAYILKSDSITYSLPEIDTTFARPSFSIEVEGFSAITSYFQGMIKSNTLTPGGTFLRSLSH